MSKENLLDRFAEAYKIDGFPPLAGRIMGMFYIYDQKYFSFDEIVSIVKASKGSVSKTLKMLIGLGRVTFIQSKEHKRKRLFLLNIDGLRHFLNTVILNYKKQDSLIKECLELRTNENLELNNFINSSVEFNAEILEFIEEKMVKYFNQ